MFQNFKFKIPSKLQKKIDASRCFDWRDFNFCHLWGHFLEKMLDVRRCSRQMRSNNGRVANSEVDIIPQQIFLVSNERSVLGDFKTHETGEVFKWWFWCLKWETPEFLPWWSCDLKRHKGAVLIQELWRGRLRARVRSLENIFPLLLLPLLFVVCPGVVERKEAVCICYFGSVNLVHFFCLHFSLFQKIMAIYRVIPLIFLHSLRYICWFRAVLF